MTPNSCRSCNKINYYTNWLKKSYDFTSWHNLDTKIYRRLVNIYMKKEINDFKVQELAILELERPYDDEINILGYFKDKSYIPIENQGKF